MKRKKCCLHCQCFSDLKTLKCKLHNLNLETIQNAKRFYCKNYWFLYDKIPSIT